MAAPGTNYTDDTFYRPIEAPLEQKYGLPQGALADIRTKGERTNANVVSPAGARTVYQIMPANRDALANRAGLNAYASPASAAEASAMLLHDAMAGNGGNWANAVRSYIGGNDPKNWGPITHDYVARVTGQATPARTTVSDAIAASRAPYIPPTINLSALTPEQKMSLPSSAFSDGGRDLPLKTDMAYLRALKQAAVDTTAVERASIPTPAPKADFHSAIAWHNASVTEQQHTNSLKGQLFTQLDAAMSEHWMSDKLFRGMANEQHEGDPTWHQKFEQNMQNYLSFAQNEHEVDALTSSRAMNSEADFNSVKTELEASRQRQAVINSTGHGGLYNLAGAITDPIGLLAFEGVGSIVNAARGSKALTVGSEIAKNMGFSAVATGIDAYSGEHGTSKDVMSNMATGLFFGLAMHGVHAAVGKVEAATVQRVQEQDAATAAELDQAARAKAGPNATDAQVEQARQEVMTDRLENVVRYHVADRDDADRFLPTSLEDLQLERNQNRVAAIQKNGFDTWADPAEASLAAEMAERSKTIAEYAMKGGTLDKGLEGKFLKAFGQESDALAMLRSNNPTLQAVAIQLLESTTGAGGRKPSAAISKVLRERSYMRRLIDIDRSWETWRKSEGISKVQALTNPEHRLKFDRAVWDEVWSRGEGAQPIASKPSVVAAADAWERGMDQMRTEMQHVRTLGSERLGTTSRGYMRQIISSQKVINLKERNPEGYKNVVGILAKQFSALNEYSFVTKEGEKITKNFDMAFSKKLAQRYLDEAVGRGKGSQYVPANLHTPEAASVIHDALKAMTGLSEKEQEAILGRFSRGGASYTKGRLNIDMNAEIGNGMKMGDLFNQDVISLYRQYASRTSGEVALAQYGIYGKQGLQMLRRIAEAQGVGIKELQALERVSAEFLGEPWGKGSKSDAALRNSRNITSAVQLGGMAFPQFAEYANALPQLGVRGTLGAVASIPQMLKEARAIRGGKSVTNPILNDFDKLYGDIGSDWEPSYLFNAHDNGVELYDRESMGTFTKIARGASHFNAVASGFKLIHVMQQRGIAEQIVRKALRYVKEGTNDVALRDMGFDDGLLGRIKEKLPEIASWDAKGRLTKVNFMDSSLDPRDVQDFAQAIKRGAGQIIQDTYIGERGAWAHNELLKTLFQFRTFGITSIEKQYGRGVANYGAIKTFALMMGGMAFAIPIHITRVLGHTIGMSDAQAKDYKDKHLNVAALGRAVMNYSSAMGVAPDMLDIGTGIGSKIGLMPAQLDNDLGTRGRQSDFGSLVPAIGYLNNSYKGVFNAAEGAGGVVGLNQKPNSTQKLANALKLLPGASLPYVAPLINGVTPDKQH